MKILPGPFLFGPAVALFCALSFTLLAQQPPAAPEPAAPPPASDDDRSKMRRIDQPAADQAGETPASTKAKKTRAQQIKERNDEAHERSLERARRAAAHTGDAVVNVFGNSHLVAGEKTDAVVAVFGSATSEGEVAEAVVSVFGSNRVTGPVHGAVVAVFGNSYVNSSVTEAVVVVFGNLELGPEARIAGEVVCVGGTVTRDPGAVLKRGIKNVASINVQWLQGWLEQCLLKARLLAFDSRLGWAWATAFSFLAFYLLLALLFPRAVVTCAETLETRPGYSLLASVLTVLLTPVAVVVLALTVVGAVLVPFLGAALMFASLFGKAVMLAWMGRRMTKFFGDGPLGHPIFAVLIGGVIVMLLYTIPFAGFLFYKLLSWLGLGVVVYTVALAMKREKASKLAAAPPAPLAPVAPVAWAATPIAAATPMAAATPPTMSSGFSGSGIVATEISAAPDYVSPPPVAPMPLMPPLAVPVALPLPPPVVPATGWERAGFFIRLAALALDGVLIGMIVGVASSTLPPALSLNEGPGGVLLALAIYGAVMWKLKGTTIGGIICGLKVVRIDHREIDWATAIVRALGCFLSLAVAGLGFIWVAFDDEKQSWHDKIAGTTVVRVPKGVSLV